jgi:tetratricopeptide (TPR) repeat protein
LGVDELRYATCEAEADRIVKSPGRTDFIDITSLQVNPKPRQADSLDIHYFGKAIANSPVYEIKGTAVVYSCAAIDNSTGRRGKNCLNTSVENRKPNNSEGLCFKEPSGNWRCRLSVGTGRIEYGPPPNSNNASGSSQTQTASNNNSASYYNRQAAIKWQNKDYQGALADMNRAIQIEPNNPRLYVDRSQVKLYSFKDRSGAIKDWQQAANLFRQQGDTRAYLHMLWLVKKYQNRSD